MSSDEPALLRAVLADPLADEPRRAYAAFLAQSERPTDRARAEFIYTQLDLNRQSGEGHTWAERVGRERELLERHRVAWEKPLRDRLRPSLASTGRWLKSHLFGSGGRWGFRRGFVEHVLAAAPSFLAEDVAILAHAPVRRVVLSHATEYIGPLAADDRLDRLDSLHLVGDMELDEDLSRLTEDARSVGLAVLEFRLPRLWPDAADLFEVLRAPMGEDDGRDPNDFPAWSLADVESRRRLASLAGSPRVALLTEDAAHEGELLALNEWVYLGKSLAEAGAWAVAKGHQDLEDDDGRCRRLALVRKDQGGELRSSPHFHGELE
ncbi:MAG TPA: hypothetical protein VHR66_10715 [Gemmataceae bacterium]|jgi:uncharacterized protein (TIGR02996 family)|nr:hypothetical protein [Gemmataceae bacterium]